MSAIAKKMMRILCILLFVLVAAAVLYYRSFSFLPFALGALLGTAVSAGKVLLLDRAVDKAIAMEKKKAGNYITLQHLLRMVLTAGVLISGAIIPVISLWGVAAGIFAYPISMYVLKYSPHASDSSNVPDSPKN